MLLAAAAAMWGGITAARIGHELQRRGENVNWFLMRIHMLRWVPRYKEVTIAETGRPGPLYRQFVVAMRLALVLAAAALLWGLLER
jgi:hypothetical protein